MLSMGLNLQGTGLLGFDDFVLMKPVLFKFNDFILIKPVLFNFNHRYDIQ